MLSVQSGGDLSVAAGDHEKDDSGLSTLRKLRQLETLVRPDAYIERFNPTSL